MPEIKTQAALDKAIKAEPAAKCREGDLWWRGSNATFTYLLPVTAPRLLAKLEADPCLADLAAERDKRQQLETEIANIKAAQTAQAEALAKAFGVLTEGTRKAQEA